MVISLNTIIFFNKSPTIIVNMSQFLFFTSNCHIKAIQRIIYINEIYNVVVCY